MVSLLSEFIAFILLPHVSGYLAIQNADHGLVLVSNMLNKLSGQPDSYEKKYEPLPLSPPLSRPGRIRAHKDPVHRASYRFGRTLGAGTYGIVREAESPTAGMVAVKIILKKNVRGNEKMVYDELEMLQALHHPSIVHFVDWFESKVVRPVSDDNCDRV